MLAFRIYGIGIILLMCAAVLLQWHLINGFNPLDLRWWVWLGKATWAMAFPGRYTSAMIWAALGTLPLFVVASFVAARPFSRTRGKFAADNLHDDARWASRRDVRKAGLLAKDGVVLGKANGRILRHNGPEHVLLDAPTRSGKGVSTIVPTLQAWLGSVVVLDIKGENFALTGGYRAKQGQRVLCFKPTAKEALNSNGIKGSALARFNPLAEVRIGTPYVVRDVQNIAQMIIDREGNGLKSYWEQEAFPWLTGVIVHVMVRVERSENRRANLADVNTFLSGASLAKDETPPGPSGGVQPSEQEKLDQQFVKTLQAMLDFDHRDATLNKVVREAVGRMVQKAPQERSGVHSNAITGMGLWADPLVVANTATSDFTIDEVMSGTKPLSLYIVIPPPDIERLRPLLRLLLNVLVRRLMEDMAFEGGAAKASYKHRLLLLLDEFPSLGKMEIFETAPAYMAGYGIKCLFVVQSLEQLQAVYGQAGKSETISTSCNCQIYFTPNANSTAEKLSKRIGKTTVIKESRNRSGRIGAAFSISDSQTEVARDLMTPREIMTMGRLTKARGLRRLLGRTVVPGDALVFAAGVPPIYATQHPYFEDKKLQARTCITAPPL